MKKTVKWAGIVLGGLLVFLVLAGGVLYYVGSNNLSRTYAVQTARLTVPADSASIARGAHIVDINGCRDCHGERLQGVEHPPHPGSPPAPALAAAGQWSLDEFKETLRTGVTPGGKTLDPEFMPWPATAHMTDDELAALHAHLATLATRRDVS